MGAHKAESLKKDLVGKTMVGEFVGNPGYEHVVKYDKETIFFFALVENNSAHICYPSRQAHSFFHRHGLQQIPGTVLGTFKSYEKMCEALEKEYVLTSESSIEEEEEGSVLYFLKFDHSDPSQEEVLSICKVKTLEYRLFKKMRDMLRRYVEEPTKTRVQDMLANYERHAKEITRGLRPPKHVNFYIDFFQCAVDLVYDGMKTDKWKMYVEWINDEYVTFLMSVLDEFNKDRKKKIMMTFESRIMHRE